MVFYHLLTLDKNFSFAKYITGVIMPYTIEIVTRAMIGVALYSMAPNFAGAKFGAIEYNAAPIIALVTISIVYGIVTPMMYFVNEKFLPNINK